MSRFAEDETVNDKVRDLAEACEERFNATVGLDSSLLVICGVSSAIDDIRSTANKCAAKFRMEMKKEASERLKRDMMKQEADRLKSEVEAERMKSRDAENRLLEERDSGKELMEELIRLRKQMQKEKEGRMTAEQERVKVERELAEREAEAERERSRAAEMESKLLEVFKQPPRFHQLNFSKAAGMSDSDDDLECSKFGMLGNFPTK